MTCGFFERMDPKTSVRGRELTRRIIQQLNRLSNELWVANQMRNNGPRERDKVESYTSYVMGLLPCAIFLCWLIWQSWTEDIEPTDDCRIMLKLMCKHIVRLLLTLADWAFYL